MVSMFMKKSFAMAFAVALSVAGLTSCGGDDDEPEVKPTVVTKTVSFEAQSFTDWTYFSFSKGEIVNVDQTNYKNDLSWDMGFLRFNVRTNGGESGKGQGAAYDTGMKQMSEVTTLPASGFVTDTTIKVMESGGMPPKYVETTGNTAFKVGDNQGWAFYDYRNAVWSYNNNVFIIRTADGQYAKVIMKSFLNDQDKSGFITFEYEYPFLEK